MYKAGTAKYFYRAFHALLAAWCVITFKIMMWKVLLTNTRSDLLINLLELIHNINPLWIYVIFYFFLHNESWILIF